MDDEKVESTVPVKSPAEGKELVVSHPLSDKRNNDDSRESAEVVHNNLFEKRRKKFFWERFLNACKTLREKLAQNNNQGFRWEIKSHF